MCGIIGYTGKNRAVPYLLKGLHTLEYRGYDSAGVATQEKNGIGIVKTEGRLYALQRLIDSKTASDSRVGIGHTRWATHGEPSKLNAHPHQSDDGNFCVVHNGIIENYSELKKSLQNEGIIFKSQTDTEVIAHLLMKNYDGDLVSTIIRTADMLSGTYALCILCRDFPDKIVCTRMGSPLVVGMSDSGVFVASDILAMAGNAETVFYPDDGETAVLTKDNPLFFDKTGKQIFKAAEEVTLCKDDADKQGYDHFMLKEIMEQPKAVRETLSSIIKDGEIKFKDFSLSKQSAEKIRNIYIVACGSAYHIGVCGKYILEELTGIPTHTDIASEFRYRNAPIKENDLCIVISQSGETADSIAAIKKAKEKGSRVLSVVNVEGSTIPKLSDYVIYTKAGPEIAVATTKAYSAQLCVIYTLALYIAYITDKISQEQYSNYLKEIDSLPEKIEETLKITDCKAKELAKLFKKKEHAYFIGRGTDYAAALEASLKMKEISYIHSEAYGAGELKHGTISLIENGTIVVALMANDRTFHKTDSNVKEVMARKAEVIAVTTEKHRLRAEEFDHSIIIPDASYLVLPSLEILPMQLLSYYTALLRECDIDKPRNLAKSVTVE